MKQIRKRLTYANVMSTIAVFLVVGGASALAATQLGKNTVGSTQLKKNAVVAAKIKNNAVTSAKLADGSVTNGKLGASAVSTDKVADGAVTTGKLAGNAVNTDKILNSAVTSAKLAGDAVSNGKLADDSVTAGKIAGGSVGSTQLTESERSQAFVSATSASTQALANGVFGNYTPAESVTSLVLPAGTYMVTAQSEFINVDITAEYTAIHNVVCRLLDDGAEVAEQSATVLPGLLAPSGGVTAIGISNGGQLNLACRQGATNKVSAYKAKITAVRVGAVTGP